MRRLAAGCFAAMLAACGGWTVEEQRGTATGAAAVQEKVETAAAVGGELRLTVKGKECTAQLGAAGAAVRLGVAGPCAIMRDHKGSAQTYRYEDVGGAQVYVVVGEMQGECGTSAQGLLVRGKEMQASTLIQKGSYKCPKAGMDEKGYWMFAHQ